MKISFYKVFLGAASLLTLISCRPSTKVIKQPVTLYGNSFIKVKQITLSDTATIIHAKANKNYKGNWTMPDSVWLSFGSNKYYMKRGIILNGQTNDILLQADSTYNASNNRNDSLCLYFPPLPKGLSTVTLKSKEGQSPKSIFGIRLDGKEYKPFIKMPKRGSAADGWHLSDSLPDWKPCSGKSVICGRRLSSQKDACGKDNYSYFLINNAFTGEAIRFSTDSTGTFRFEIDLAYPTCHSFSIGPQIHTFLMLPGDSINLEYDFDAMAPKLAALENAGDDRGRQFYEMMRSCIRRGGGGIPEADAIRAEAVNRSIESAIIRNDVIRKYMDEPYHEYVERIWQQHTQYLARLDSIAWLTPAGRTYLQLVSEQTYLQQRKSYASHRSFFLKDKDSLAMFKAQMTDVDPHAKELAMPHSLRGTYVAEGNTHYSYFTANNLLQTPMGQWMQELKKAMDMRDIINNIEVVNDNAAFDTIAPIYRHGLQALNDTVKAKIQQLAAHTIGQDMPRPDGEPSTWLRQIVAAYKGHPLIIDMWASWCGPCMMGINEMKKTKPRLLAQGCKFIYITDESTPATKYVDLVKEQKGQHYRLKQNEISAMNIPDYRGSIPHYLIYDAGGNLIKTQIGWPGIKRMEEIIENALTKRNQP